MTEPTRLFSEDAHRTWDTFPHAWYDENTGNTIFSALKSDGTRQVYHYDHATTRLWSRQSYASDGSADTHNTSSVLILSEDGPLPGQPVFSTTGHNNSLRFRTGNIAGKVGALRPQVAPGTNSATYPFLCQMTDTAKTLYCLYRVVAFGAPNQWFRRLRTSTDGGITWSAETDWFVSDDGDNLHRPYFNYAHSGSRIDFMCTRGHWNEVADNALYAGYMTVAANGTRSWFKSDGTLIGLDAVLPLDITDLTPVVGPEPNTNYAVVDMGHSEGVVTALIVKMTPYDSATTLTYYLTKLIGGSWTEPEFVVEAGEPGTTPHELILGAWHVPGGGAIDPNDEDVLFLSRKYGSDDFRLEKWQSTGGIWSKTADISGNTGNKNCYPFAVKNAPATQIMYVRGTITNGETFDTDIYTFPGLPIGSAPTTQVKPASPAWQADNAPAGAESYIALTEGSGATVQDFVPGNQHPGTFTGSPAWASGSLGSEVNTFSTSNYIAHTFSTQDIYHSVYPFWVAVLLRYTGTTADMVPVSFGNSGTASPFVLINMNAGTTTNQTRWNGQSTGGVGWNIQSTTVTVNDGNPHVIMGAMWSATHGSLFVDGQQVADQTNATIGANPTLNLMTTGALRRTTVSNAFSGAVIAVAHGEGGAPDPLEIAEDWLLGTFAAIREPVYVAGTAYRLWTAEPGGRIWVATREQ